MIQFRKYCVGDLWCVMNQEDLYKFDFRTDEDIDPELTWTAIDNLQIIGCGGFRKFWNGVYEVWIASKPGEFHNHKVQTIKFIIQKLKEIDFHRIQATLVPIDIKSCKFARFIGFRIEGTLKQYGPDKQDYLMAAMVK